MVEKRCVHDEENDIGTWENDSNMKHKNFFSLKLRHKNYNRIKGIYIWLVECERINDNVKLIIVIYNNFDYLKYQMYLV